MGPNRPNLAVEQLFGSVKVIGEPNGQASFPKEQKGTNRKAGMSILMRTGAGPASEQTSGLYLACIQCPRVRVGSAQKVKSIQ